ncbi:MAG TPA: cysteine hydrolase [Acidimicrobiales bacterium]|jgi:nicotinamidase-related amidase
MPIDLHEMLDPAKTAVVTMELQRSIAGEGGALPDLRAQIAPVLPNVRRLLTAARSASVPVVHCIAGPSKVPSAPPNYPLAAAMARRREGAGDAPPPDPEALARGLEVVPDIGPEPTDVRVVRSHGLTPFTGTELDAVLRQLGVQSVVAAGVSLNIGIIGLSVEAVGLGYRVAVVTDGVAGTPAEYGQAVLQNTVRMVATLVQVDQVVDLWATR